MQLGFDLIALDRARMIEDEKTLTVKDAVIAREIVHAYNGEMIYKPADELFKATFTAGNAWLTETHPPIGLVTDRSEMRGTVRNPHFKNNGIYSDLVFFKDLCSPTFLQEVKSGERDQLSIGYTYNKDPTMGTWNGEAYDSIQRNFCINHVAVVKERARCPPPFCGIGVDEIIKVINLKNHLEREGKKIGGDPWEETTGEIRQRVQDPSKFDDESFRSSTLPGTRGIRIIVACPVGKWDDVNKRCKVGMQLQAYRFSKEAGWTLAKAKEWYKEHHQDAAKTFEEADVKCETGLDEYIEGLMEAAQDQEREAKKRAAEERAARYKIAVKPGGNLSPPKGYPARPEQYGDPTNFRYPLDTKIHRGAALRYFAKPKNRRQYSRREQLIIWERIVRALLRHGEVHRYDKNNPLDRGLPVSLKRRLPGYEA